MQWIDHRVPSSRMRSLLSALQAGLACLSVALCQTTAFGQLDWYIQFEAPAYLNSPVGVPLAGQDGWFQVGPPGGGEWKVYSNGNNTLGVPVNTAGLMGFAGIVVDPGAPGYPEPVAIERNVSFAKNLHFTIDIMVDHNGTPPVGRDIARISFEPEEFSASLALIPTWVDPGKSTEWTLDIVYYTEEGEQMRTPFTVPPSNFKTKTWYEFHVIAVTDTREIKSIGVVMKPDGFSVAGQYTGLFYLGPSPALPSSVRVSANTETQPGTTLAIDNIYTLKSPCYADCDRDGGLWFFDFLCFQNLFLAGDPYADCDGSGNIDFFDFLCFSNNFSGGCFP